MPYFQQQVYSSAATEPSLNLDTAIAPFNAVVNCIVGGGATTSYKMQYTYDNFDSPTMTDAAANWIDSTDIPAATATSKSSNLTVPVSRIRIVIATLTGGTLTLQVRQGLSIN
jgi:hypothetical protein